MKNAWTLVSCLLLLAYLTLGHWAGTSSASDSLTQAFAAQGQQTQEEGADEKESEEADEQQGDDNGQDEADDASDDDKAKDDDAKDDDEADGAKDEGKAEADAKEDKSEDKADEKAKDDDSKDSKDDDKRKTHTVKAKPLKIEIESDGVFVAREMSEIDLDPEAWSEFEIVEIVPHGATVHEGEVLVKFDSEKIKEALDDLELDQRISELAIMKAEQELPRLEKSLKDNLEQAERSLDEAKVDYKNYQEVDRDLLKKSIEMNLKSTQQSVENAREELRQLEKMYEADDLTEETEEIILQRQRAQVEQYEFMLERAELSHDRNLELYLPRNDIAEKEFLEQVELAFERAKTAVETDLRRQRYELQKAKRARTKSLERHADLTSDLSLLTIKAPADGVVYYGACTDGEWNDAASLIEKLKPEKNAPTGSTLMTIVGPAELYVESTVTEANRPSVKKGQTATIQPTATDSRKLAAKVSKVSKIPVSQGKFDLELELVTDELPEWLVAGMTGKAKVTTYEKKDAIVVPKKAVHSEKDDEDKKYVWLVEGDDVEKQKVKTGKTNGDDIEIVEGLSDGDKISLDDEDEDTDDTDE